uniref:N-acetylmuramoyl-L-alanine amidase n=1 Tax=Alloprevotella sp. TaxID=1872471 RepID=UPI003FEFF9B2
MKNYLSKFLYIVLFVAFLPTVAWSNAEKRNFTLVIDAGHGGHDAGAVGAYSKEKDINLRVALAFGKLVEENCHNVKVVYTRKTDVFIPLQRRADIANNNKADLFISVHTNALPAGRLAYGSETYTLGMARANANLAVAKRENAVITLENDYKTTYQGFDPNKAESYVIFEFMQDKYMKQSVDLASCIQKQYVSTGRPNKGVHQAGFLVLRNTSMPSVLTELGFITTPAEETYLNSQQGVMELSRSIYNGFLAYLRMHEKGVHDIPENLPTRMTTDLPKPKVSEPIAEPSNFNNSEAAVVPVATVPTTRIVETPNDNDVALISRRSNNAKHSTAKHATPKAEPKREVETKEKAPTNHAKEKSKLQENTTKTKEAAQSKNTLTKGKETPKSKDVASTSKAQGNTTRTKEASNTKKEQANSSKPTSKESTPNSKSKDAPKEIKSKNKVENKSKTGHSKTSKKNETTLAKGKTQQRTNDKTNETKKASKTSTKQKVNYRIQVGAGKTEISTTDAQFKGLSISRVKEGTLYKYYYGSYTSYADAQKALRTVKTKLSSAYVVATVNGKSVSVAEARAKEQEKK